VVGANPDPDRLATVPLGPVLGVRFSVAMVTVNGASTTRPVPFETSTHELPVDGTSTLVPDGMAPPLVAVKVDPEGHAAAVAWKQYRYVAPDPKPDPASVTVVPGGP
jgi:hypothetical protein